MKAVTSWVPDTHKILRDTHSATPHTYFYVSNPAPQTSPRSPLTLGTPGTPFIPVALEEPLGIP